MAVNAGELKLLIASHVRRLVTHKGLLLHQLIHLARGRADANSAASGLRHVTVSCMDGHYASSFSRSPLETDLLGQSRFKLMEVLRIDLGLLLDESIHLAGHLPLDLQLLHVADLSRDRVLAEEVTHEDLLDV